MNRALSIIFFIFAWFVEDFDGQQITRFFFALGFATFWVFVVKSIHWGYRHYKGGKTFMAH